MSSLRTLIEDAFSICDTFSSQHCPADIQEAIFNVVNQLDQGQLRIAEKISGHWQVHEWIKKAILLYFKIQKNQVIHSEAMQWYDKIPLKFSSFTEEDWETYGIRAVPGSFVRKGAFIAKNTILMPSYVNIGAYVDTGTLVDTWATVGSCAQIGKNVHLSGGVGIGGVLEPLQAQPTIIEDGCFIGARSEIVEGVVVEEGSVISMGVYIGQSTPIYHRATQTITYGRIPPFSVVIPGSLPSKDGTHHLYCAVIVKQVDEKTRSKTSLNELLRIVD